MAYVIPTPKPNKVHADPSSYRPIALTSALRKVVEIRVSHRLLDYLGKQNGFATIQAGGIAGRCTTDHLIRLDNAIRRGFKRNEDIISIFFDMEKAFDKTWKYGVLKDMYDFGLRGKLPEFVEAFLRDRRFQVRVGGTLSRVVKQENGIPHGSLLSPTLFIIKMESLVACMQREERFLVSTYMDDLQLSYAHSDLSITKQKLQDVVNELAKWGLKNGLTE